MRYHPGRTVRATILALGALAAVSAPVAFGAERAEAPVEAVPAV
jgi:hypothetical protein